MNDDPNNSPLSHDPSTSPSSVVPASVSDTARAAWDTTQQKVGEALQSSETYIRENPGSSALGLFGVGFVVGVLVGWTIAHEEHNTYRRAAKRWAGKLHFD